MLDDRTHNKHTRVQITNPLELFPWQVRLLLYRSFCCTLLYTELKKGDEAEYTQFTLAISKLAEAVRL